MKKIGLCLVFLMTACASPKPALKTPASNPYVNRPNLLNEQAEVVKLKKFGDRMMFKCRGALSLVPDEKAEKDEKKRDLFRAAALNFCSERFDDFVKAAEAATPKVHGKYLEAVILWKHMGKAFQRVAQIAILCTQVPKDKKQVCQNVANTRQMIANVLAFVTEEFQKEIIPVEDDDDSKPKSDKKK